MREVEGFPEKKYSIIYADPPWSYPKTGGKRSSRGMAKQHYQTMPIQDRKERKAMTIDEAIAHAREVAEGCRAENGDCAYQHDKLTEWLVELKAYRETGLKPEEIADFREMYREMAAKFADYKAAEVTGQLVVFPCRVTDTVYYIETVHKGRKYAGGRVVSAQIDHVTIGGTTGKPVFDLCTETENWLYALEPGEFFLTREEAEKALEEGRKNGEY